MSTSVYLYIFFEFFFGALCLFGLIYMLYSLVIVVLSFLFRYETSDLLKEYRLAQYGIFLSGTHKSQSESFYKTILEELIPFIDTNTRYLDIGCGLGRLVFELEKLGIKSSTGIDTSKSFIRYCTRLQNKKDRGNLFEPRKNSMATFICGDILDYGIENSQFDLISCINVIDRVKDPQLLLDRTKNILAPNGILIITTPYDWSLSPAQPQSRFEDLSELFKNKDWKIIKETKSIPYNIASNRKEYLYNCDMVIVQKR